MFSGESTPNTISIVLWIKIHCLLHKKNMVTWCHPHFKLFKLLLCLHARCAPSPPASHAITFNINNLNGWPSCLSPARITARLYCALAPHAIALLCAIALCAIALHIHYYTIIPTPLYYIIISSISIHHHHNHIPYPLSFHF